MSIETQSVEASSDLEAVLHHLVAGTPMQAELSLRVRARSERMTEELRRRYGQFNVAVDLVREVRDEA